MQLEDDICGALHFTPQHKAKKHHIIPPALKKLLNLETKEEREEGGSHCKADDSTSLLLKAFHFLSALIVYGERKVQSSLITSLYIHLW